MTKNKSTAPATSTGYLDGPGAGAIPELLAPLLVWNNARGAASMRVQSWAFRRAIDFEILRFTSNLNAEMRECTRVAKKVRSVGYQDMFAYVHITASTPVAPPVHDWARHHSLPRNFVIHLLGMDMLDASLMTSSELDTRLLATHDGSTEALIRAVNEETTRLYRAACQTAVDLERAVKSAFGDDVLQMFNKWRQTYWKGFHVSHEMTLICQAARNQHRLFCSSETCLACGLHEVSVNADTVHFYLALAGMPETNGASLACQLCAHKPSFGLQMDRDQLAAPDATFILVPFKADDGSGAFQMICAHKQCLRNRCVCTPHEVSASSRAEASASASASVLSRAWDTRPSQPDVAINLMETFATMYSSSTLQPIRPAGIWSHACLNIDYNNLQFDRNLNVTSGNLYQLLQAFPGMDARVSTVDRHSNIPQKALCYIRDVARDRIAHYASLREHAIGCTRARLAAEVAQLWTCWCAPLGADMCEHVSSIIVNDMCPSTTLASLSQLESMSVLRRGVCNPHIVGVVRPLVKHVSTLMAIDAQLSNRCASNHAYAYIMGVEVAVYEHSAKDLCAKCDPLCMDGYQQSGAWPLAVDAMHVFDAIPPGRGNVGIRVLGLCDDVSDEDGDHCRVRGFAFDSPTCEWYIRLDDTTELTGQRVLVSSDPVYYSKLRNSVTNLLSSYKMRLSSPIEEPSEKTIMNCKRRPSSSSHRLKATSEQAIVCVASYLTEVAQTLCEYKATRGLALRIVTGGSVQSVVHALQEKELSSETLVELSALNNVPVLPTKQKCVEKDSGSSSSSASSPPGSRQCAKASRSVA